MEDRKVLGKVKTPFIDSSGSKIAKRIFQGLGVGIGALAAYNALGVYNAAMNTPINLTNSGLNRFQGTDYSIPISAQKEFDKLKNIK